jgi:hypothetical protein
MDRFYVEGVLREKAARMGADALVVVADRFFRGAVVYNYWHGPRAVFERHIVGIAIRFRRYPAYFCGPLSVSMMPLMSPRASVNWAAFNWEPTGSTFTCTSISW